MLAASDQGAMSRDGTVNTDAAGVIGALNVYCNALKTWNQGA
jgi:hypothetical protein